MTQTARTPEWLLGPPAAPCPCCGVGRGRGDHIARTLEDGSRLLRGVLEADLAAAAGGPLARLDPRVKVVGLLALLVAAGLAHRPAPLVVLHLATVALAVLAGIGAAAFLRRVWLLAPLFTAVIALPALLGAVTPGDVLVPLPIGGGITREGLGVAVLLVLRVATSVGLVVLVTATTPWPRLLAGLRALRLPRMLVLVLGMTLRYLLLLLDTVLAMYEARRARLVGRQRDARAGRRLVTASAGALFGRSQALAEEVHMAMTARGYRGDVRLLDPLALRTADALALAAVLGAAVLLVLADRGLA